MDARVARSTYRYCVLTVLLAASSSYATSQPPAAPGKQKVSFEAAAKQCSSAGSLRYCVYRAAAGTNRDIIYHLHGRNLDEHIWNDDTYYTAMIQDEWQRNGSRPPTVVTVSYGGTWLLAPKGAKPESGLLEDFMARLPEIESKVGVPRRRILLGESMGGLNVLVAGLSHPSKFAKVAALCPGVYVDSPFAPAATLQAATQRTGANPQIAMGAVLMGKQYLASDAEWRRMSPLRLIENARPSYPRLYLSNGLYDAWGNYEGTERLARLAQQRGVKTEWHPLYGGHCAIDVRSLSKFLAT